VRFPALQPLARARQTLGRRFEVLVEHFFVLIDDAFDAGDVAAGRRIREQLDGVYTGAEIFQIDFYNFFSEKLGVPQFPHGKIWH
jgi:hypothetical protein